ncbi:TetR/AcrR family transcriptional regulator [Amycolatopsis sp. NPDC059021]|uniref:TetR/AcrR family transcriptional regulator n=1 Tax=Amycolatopsis sp. NPDC059021 TaxID=3346704 RepID=UPI003672A279
MNKKAERGQATREHLVAVATRLFTERGYEGTSIEAVLRDSGVSRGALYHHFGGKDALFAAVLDTVYDRTGESMAAATRDAPDPVSALRAGCRAWIRLTADPAVHRIVLIDAPSVLGWQRWRELDERRVLRQVKVALAAATDAAHLDPGHVVFFAHALLASMNEIAMLIARADDPAAAAAEADTAVDELLHRILEAPAAPPR